MKKLAIVAAGLAIMSLFSSCKKEKESTPESTVPVLDWEANAKFAQQEISTDMDACVEITAEEGIEVLNLSFTKLPEDLRGVVKQHIGNYANKTGNSLIMDAIDDATVAEYFSGLGLPSGSALRGSTSCQFNFKYLLEDILKNQILDNNSIIAISLSVIDAKDQSVSKTLNFHYTSGPEITWPSNPEFSTIELNTVSKWDCALKFTTPGKIADVVMTVNTKSKTLASTLNAFVTTPGTDAVTVNLVNDQEAVKYFANYGIPTGNSLVGATSTTFDLTNFIKTLVTPLIKRDANGEENSINVKVVDALGKEMDQTVVFKYTAAE